MNFYEKFELQHAKAICYSGFRDGQQPGGFYPSYDEVKDDLLILQNNWKYLQIESPVIIEVDICKGIC